jgi:predicted RNase H-like HicB family nuclease
MLLEVQLMSGMYELRIEIEELNDGGDYKYMGTSPDLPNLIVVGDTVDEVLARAPGVAQALIETMREYSQRIPKLPEAHEPWQTHVLVLA